MPRWEKKKEEKKVVVEEKPKFVKPPVHVAPKTAPKTVAPAPAPAPVVAPVGRPERPVRMYMTGIMMQPKKKKPGEP